MINRIQHSPSFGHLYILTDKNGSNNYMMNASDKQLDAIDQAGKDLKDAEHCHLVVDEDGGRVVETPFANKYFGGTFYIEDEEPDNALLPFVADWAGYSNGNLNTGEKYKGFIMFMNADAARNAYHDIKQTPLGSIERDVKMTKYFDDQVKLKNALADEESRAKAVRQEKAQELMNAYRRPDKEE